MRMVCETQEPALIHRLLSDLKECGRTRNLVRGRQAHGQAAQCRQDTNVYIASALIDMYAKCGSMASAHQVFAKIKQPDVVSWTALILGYAEDGQGLVALDLFKRMKTRGPAPNAVTFVAVLKSCKSIAANADPVECRVRGEKIHILIVETGCDSNTYVQNTLMDMYASCGAMQNARQVFDSIQHPDVVSWNVLVLGYALNGQGVLALELFNWMLNRGFAAPDSVSFVAALKACTSVAVSEGPGAWVECRHWGKELHHLAMRHGCSSNLFVKNTFIDMYSKLGVMVDAQQVFNSIGSPDVVSWNSLITGYAENGQGLAALKLFTRMKCEGPTPDYVTFLCALKACGLVGGLEYGRTIHLDIGKCKHLDLIMVTCLVDFYAKCGSLVEAQSVFDSHRATRNILTWTALLAGFSSCGDHESVFGLFEGMQDAGLLPDSTVFRCILACCAHAGLVEKGTECFNRMATKHGFVPSVEHYTCMVDIFGRASKLDEAMALLQFMPCSPDIATWRTLLSACRRWKNVNVGRLAFQTLMKLIDGDSAAYLLMAQTNASRDALEEVPTIPANLELLEETCWTDEAAEVHTFPTYLTEHN